MKNLVKTIFVLSLLANLLSSQLSAASSSTNHDRQLPALNPRFSPLAEENKNLLFERIVATFDKKYKTNQHENKNLAKNSTVYYLSREIQALIDMWRATKKQSYLDQAENLVLKAISDAQKNQHVLLRYNKNRGKWPCFFEEDLQTITGGHGQLGDFQGATSFMMVAVALHETRNPSSKEIADFVEKNVIEKWFSYNPGIKPNHLTGSKSNMYLLIVLDSSRGKRSHFASICMALHNLGYNKYPYHQWAKFLTEVYLGKRTSLSQPYPKAKDLGNVSPDDWGVIPNKKTGGLVWYWTKDNTVQDTSHANHTVWLAAEAYQKKLIDQTTLISFVNTLKYQVWASEKKGFYFNNFIDKTDKPTHSMGPGGIGNVWFGWHRLGAYDENLKNLFISMAYDLTNGGPNIVGQNKGMKNAQLCLLAWGARLLSPNGQPNTFP
ncbi:MAG: hypothetical protein K9M75_04945 [Phycisphaerae bacterium]|nr:hypothetical protein [Phycisphaerae bacterium]